MGFYGSSELEKQRQAWLERAQSMCQVGEKKKSERTVSLLIRVLRFILFQENAETEKIGLFDEVLITTQIGKMIKNFKDIIGSILTFAYYYINSLTWLDYKNHTIILFGVIKFYVEIFTSLIKLDKKYFRFFCVKKNKIWRHNFFQNSTEKVVKSSLLNVQITNKQIFFGKTQFTHFLSRRGSSARRSPVLKAPPHGRRQTVIAEVCQCTDSVQYQANKLATTFPVLTCTEQFVLTRSER